MFCGLRFYYFCLRGLCDFLDGWFKDEGYFLFDLIFGYLVFYIEFEISIRSLIRDFFFLKYLDKVVVRCG